MSFWAAGFWEGQGVGGVVVNDGILAELSTMEIEVEAQDTPVLVEVADQLVVELSTQVIEVEIVE